MITTNTRLAGVESTQVLVDIQTADGNQSGLAQTSAVKCENIHTLPHSLVARRIGKLPDALMRQVDAALKASLGLP